MAIKILIGEKYCDIALVSVLTSAMILSGVDIVSNASVSAVFADAAILTSVRKTANIDIFGQTLIAH